MDVFSSQSINNTSYYNKNLAEYLFNVSKKEFIKEYFDVGECDVNEVDYFLVTTFYWILKEPQCLTEEELNYIKEQLKLILSKYQVSC